MNPFTKKQAAAITEQAKAAHAAMLANLARGLPAMSRHIEIPNNGLKAAYITINTPLQAEQLFARITGKDFAGRKPCEFTARIINGLQGEPNKCGSVDTISEFTGRSKAVTERAIAQLLVARILEPTMHHNEFRLAKPSN